MKNATAPAPAPTANADALKEVARLRDAASRLAADADRLALRLARGTDDVTTAAASAVAAARAPETAGEFAARVETALRAAPRAIAELAAEVGAPAGKVAVVLRGLRTAGRIYNVGSEDAPRWYWVVGDDASPADLQAAVEVLLRDRPFAFSELLRATGARRGRVSGVIVKMQRDGRPPLYIGDEHKGRWFIPPARAPKRTRRATRG